MRTVTTVAGLTCLALLGTGSPARAQEHPSLPPPRSIPGITAEDPHPGACVDCHVVYPEQNLDVRFATLFARMGHPAADFILADVPDSCRSCHGRDSEVAPPLGPMLHRIHLTGGASNVFLTVYQGECTHCHKLDPATGEWRIPSGPER